MKAKIRSQTEKRGKSGVWCGEGEIAREIKNVGKRREFNLAEK